MQPDTRGAILNMLHNLGVEPRPPGVMPLTGHRPYLRVRVGDYRIIYRVDDAAKKVIIAVAGHRRDIYRALS
jgi:mRNA interferase RelE/StbE